MLKLPAADCADDRSVFRRHHHSEMVSLLLSGLVLLAAECLPAAEADAKSLFQAVQRDLESGEKPVKVACFGDSITGVYYHSGSQRAWCDMLGLALEQAFPQADVEMVNAGISGHTTVNALGRIEKDVIARKPRLTVVMFGMNDVTRVPIAQYEANLRKICSDCLAAGSAVVLCTPNNVYDNGARPNGKLDQFSDVVRRVAKETNVPLVDFFRLWTDYRKADELAWIQLMSDSIHPNMNGHRLFAEQIVQEAFGLKVSLNDVPPPADGLQKTLAQLRAGKPVSMIAMPPWGGLVARRLRHHFPQAEISETVWEVEGRTAADIAKISTTVRSRKPTLVVVGLPQPAGLEDPAGLHRFWEGLLNLSFSFGSRPWDVVPVQPPVASTDPAVQESRQQLMRVFLLGKDVEYIEVQEAASAESQRNAWVDRQVERAVESD
ncbi:MAG: hypothetical protein KDA79_00145 [Planctomycetaceae bacterium]|nr:hypothetical protein [Planctomycetaceae bacterium]